MLIAAALLACATTLGCAGTNGSAAARTDFGLRATVRPSAILRPPSGGAKPGVLARVDVDGVVVLHESMPRKSFDRVLHLEQGRGAGRLKRGEPARHRLYYRLPGNAELPVQVGERLRLHYFYKPPLEGDKPSDFGYVVQRATGGALVVINVNGTIPQADLPAVAQRVRPGEARVYSEGGTFDEGCYQVRQHLELLTGRSQRLVPGGETIVQTPLGRYVLHAFDNTRPVRAEVGCEPGPPWWGYGATWLDRVVDPTAMGPLPPEVKPAQP